MAEQPSLDIASQNHWCGFRPGMSRAQVRERIQQLEMEETVYSDDNIAAESEEWRLEMWFETAGDERLRQLATDSEITWNGKPLMGEVLDQALRAMEPLGRAPMWSRDDASDDPFGGGGAAKTGPVADEELLEEGTVWLPERGLGLVLWEGAVIDIVWRDARDLPAQFAGPVTEAQRALSKRPDLSSYLRERKEAAAPATPKDPKAPLHTGLVLICLGLLAFVGYKGFEEMRVWNGALQLSGKFVSKEVEPRKKYLDLAPEAVRKHMPDDPRRTREMYNIVYLDPTLRRQSVKLEAAEFYVPPREEGEEMPLAYVDGDPPRVKGLSRASNAAFVEYFPWAIAVGVFYVIGLFSLGLVPLTWRTIVEMLLTSNRQRDSDRPELR